MNEYSIDSAAVTAAGLTALAVCVAVWAALDVAYCRRKEGGGPWYERERRGRLRSSRPGYRVLEPLVDEIRPFFSDPATNEAIEKRLRVLGRNDWRGDEARSVAVLEGLAVSAICGGSLFFLLGPVAAAITFAGVWGFYYFMALKAYQEKAQKRVTAVRHRLPFAVELIAMMMEAGAMFPDAMKTYVREDRAGPLREELQEAIDRMDMGVTRADCLNGFAEKIGDDTVRDVVRSVLKGEELGTPLAQALLRQAEQLRLMRAQWGEKAAAEAQVKIVFPGTLVMIACLIAVAAPIILPAFFSS